MALSRELDIQNFIGLNGSNYDCQMSNFTRAVTLKKCTRFFIAAIFTIWAHGKKKFFVLQCIIWCRNYTAWPRQKLASKLGALPVGLATSQVIFILFQFLLQMTGVCWFIQIWVMKPKLRQLHLANLEIQTLWPNCPKNDSVTLLFRLDKSFEGFSPNTINDVELLIFPVF